MKKKETNKKMIVLLVVLAVLVVAFTGGIFFYQNGIGAANPKDDSERIVTIPQGSGASTIIEILDKESLIKNKTAAKIHVRIGGYNSLQANTYIFNSAMTLPEIFNIINTGDFNFISKERFTIVEGSTLPQAAAKVAETTPFTAEELMALWADREYLAKLKEDYWFITDEILADGIMFPMEGYLYPDTYFVTGSELSTDSLTRMVLDKMDQELTARKAEIAATKMTVHEFLTLASVVESESLFDEDRPKITGVFINRMNKNTPLQSDITVLYALQEKRVNVTYSDLEVDSPYNTYKNIGLPIGPVSAVPGKTMDAVINYEKSDYMYFFATKDGKVIYSQTAEEHQKAVDENLWY